MTKGKYLLASPYALVPRSTWLLAVLWICWVVLLYILSSSPRSVEAMPSIPHLDKVVHFSYFFCGAILVASFFKNEGSVNLSFSSKSVLRICVLLGAIVGALDEFHQSFVEGRMGNDPADFTADVIGSYFGGFYALWAQQSLRKKRQDSEEASEEASIKIKD
ncbi:VanZ family protein [Akkermansiaceae bacterium]|nr:VanZ family protein [Akkermansiaceae bacterium]